jgi:hypothetical protein
MIPLISYSPVSAMFKNIPYCISIVFKVTVFENADSEIPEPIDDKKQSAF